MAGGPDSGKPINYRLHSTWEGANAIPSDVFRTKLRPSHLPTIAGHCFWGRTRIPRPGVNLNNIIIATQTFEEHLVLREVFRRLLAAHLRPNPEKCHFCRGSLHYLGHIVDAQGLRTDPEETSSITNWPTPTTGRKVRQFLRRPSGTEDSYRTSLEQPHRSLTKKLTKKAVQCIWGPTEEAAFLVALKTALTPHQYSPARTSHANSFCKRTPTLQDWAPSLPNI